MDDKEQSYRILRSHVKFAGEYVDTASKIPPMESLPFFLRPFARWAARAVRYLTTFITERQREFNSATVNALDETVLKFEELATELENARKDQENARKERLDAEAILLARLGESSLKIVELQRKLNKLLEETDGARASTVDNEAEKNRRLDELYVAFEDRFRGTREDIKDRLKPYLKVLEGLGHDLLKKFPALDIGCGRGEWLELLTQSGYRAKGLDMNTVMVEECLKRGFDVDEGDAVAYMRALPEKSFSAVTGIHIIEHLSAEKLVELLDESFRALNDGGVAIFESPNPQNLVVGACNFYTDPTHIKPVFPETMRFLMEYRGFESVRIEYFRPAEGSPFTAEDPATRQLHNWFFSAQDFAVIGYKPAGGPKAGNGPD